MSIWTIPSPSESIWHLGPLPLRAYALCIVLGIVAAIWIGERRWVARGGQAGQMTDVAVWAVPFGIVGARLYHVLTDWQLYFGDGAPRRPVEALYIWQGGLGIWGAIALGAVGAVIGARRMGLRLLPVLDALAPGVLVAQAMGRFGNYFNQELFGKPTELPWALSVSPSTAIEAGYPAGTTFHPTFLYEAIWNLAAFALLLWLDRRFRVGHGRMVALYVMAYTAGRGWIEMLRIDSVQLDDVLGLRWNVWTSILLFAAAALYFILSLRRAPGREESVYREGHEPVDDTSAAGAEPGDGVDAAERGDA
ncbi:prolipoprotein diacylglyceryl transferase [Nocardioides daejeonensis]|uniref:prolipoprotein diacylglyceryl transferase n=1 Tax=Nocardioides daejeonensis TaxID=1046556 RepID=UPI000D746C9E|nr:prolipoprotein diacylglyceryl transferase [Nocardioides daejeonensis]